MHDIRSTYLEGFQGTIIVLELVLPGLFEGTIFSGMMVRNGGR